jgi:hypothetical protein
MSNTRYTDPTNAADPPGGKHHDIPESDAEANKRPPDKGGAKQRDAKTAVSPETVANTEK